MKLPKRITLSILLCIGVTSQIFAAPMNKALSHSKDTKVMFSQTAGSATLKQQGHSKENYLLVLHNVNKNTLWFTDRPLREAGTMTTQSFIKVWNEGQDNFSKVNPNANLAFTDDTDKLHIIKEGVFTLSNPIYDKANNTLTYNVTLIYETFKTVRSQHLNEPVLFIDGFLCPWGQGGC